MRMMKNTRSGKLASYDAGVIAESDGRWIEVVDEPEVQPAQAPAPAQVEIPVFGKKSKKKEKAPTDDEVGVTDLVEVVLIAAQDNEAADESE